MYYMVMKNRIVVVIVAVFVVLMAGWFFIMQSNSQVDGLSLPAQPASNGSQQNNVQQPTPGPTTPSDKNLDECRRRVSNSEARQELIDEGLQACSDKFR